MGMNTVVHLINSVINVEHYDLEEFIKNVTGQEYEIASGEEMSNDSVLQMKIDSAFSGEYDKKRYDDFISGDNNSNWALRSILTGLCVKKHIMPGTYLVNISW